LKIYFSGDRFLQARGSENI